MSTPEPPPRPPAGSTPSPMDVQSAVAHSADAADLFASAPALLLELQQAVGELAASATRLTERGRRPFRPDEQWGRALADVGYRVYLLADQTGVPLDRALYTVADEVFRGATRPAASRHTDDDDWPVRS